MNDYWPETFSIAEASGDQVLNDSPELAIAVKNAMFDEIAHALLELLLHMGNLDESALDLGLIMNEP